MNKGVKRLAILLGIFGVVAWWTFIGVGTRLFYDRAWLGIIGVTAASFFIPFGLVHAIAWVVRGFRQ
jgi:hypothetical protein